MLKAPDLLRFCVVKDGKYDIPAIFFDDRPMTKWEISRKTLYLLFTHLVI